ncbi:MAG TPA: sulfite exporter TauE/SafE family protein, partial [Thermodesulfobacteriota bacterium]|nr:sulfite exporter TauE/SafE family protein [Thermodesulfobacteriota bacterium]
MNILEFSSLVFLGSLLAGFIGAATGLGGGVVIVPLLAIGFGVDIKYAMGASLVSVIATSSAAASAYVKEGFSNIRVGMFLEIATTIGAVVGAAIATSIAPSSIAVIFGLVLIYSAYQTVFPRRKDAVPAMPDKLATRLRLNSEFPTPDGPRKYYVRAVPGGFGVMFLAGALSGLLGIGSGALKVIAMDQVMRLPFKVSTTTSNFMIGVTAAASAGVFLNRGYIDPGLAMPVMLGVLAGSFAGAHFLFGASSKLLRIVFAVVICALA